MEVYEILEEVRPMKEFRHEVPPQTFMTKQEKPKSEFTKIMLVSLYGLFAASVLTAIITFVPLAVPVIAGGRREYFHRPRAKR